MRVSESTDQHDIETARRPAKRERRKAGPVQPGQHLLLKPQMLELCGHPSYSTVWLWMQHEGFPHPIEMGPANGRTTRVVWIASEVYAWLASRPRRAIGHLKQQRTAQEKAKPVAKPGGGGEALKRIARVKTAAVSR